MANAVQLSETVFSHHNWECIVPFISDLSSKPACSYVLPEGKFSVQILNGNSLSLRSQAIDSSPPAFPTCAWALGTSLSVVDVHQRKKKLYNSGGQIVCLRTCKYFSNQDRKGPLLSEQQLHRSTSSLSELSHNPMFRYEVSLSNLSRKTKSIHFGGITFRQLIKP